LNVLLFVLPFFFVLAGMLKAVSTGNFLYYLTSIVIVPDAQQHVFSHILSVTSFSEFQCRLSALFFVTFNGEKP